jgi:chemotaxis protein MotA
MITLPLGFLMVFAVLWYSFAGVNIQSFINLHSFVIVVAGTVAVTLINSTKINIVHLLKAVLKLASRDNSDHVVMESLILLAKGNRSEQVKNKHPLIDFLLELWEQGLDNQMIKVLLHQRLEDFLKQSETPVVILKNLSKYPPALGMMGTCMGMVELFSNLSGDNKDSVGANLALAMTATFYGLLLSNLFITPLADRLQHRHLMKSKQSEDVFNVLLMILKNEPVSVIENCSLEGKDNKAA